MGVRIAPVRDMDYLRTYNITIDPGIADKAGNVMTSSHKFSFTTEENKKFIEEISPVNNEVDVPLDVTISATFIRDIDVSTLNDTTVIIDDGVDQIATNISYSNRVLLIDPADSLDGLSTYTVTLTTAIGDTSGKYMENDYIWSFTTMELDTIPPEVVYVYPSGEIYEDLDVNISISFSDDIDPASIDADEFYVLNEDGAAIDGVMSVVKRSVMFNPDSDLIINSEYTAVFNGDVRDEAGNAAGINHSWRFRILGPPPDFEILSYSPVGECNSVDEIVVIEYSRKVYPSSLDVNHIFLTFTSDGTSTDTMWGAIEVLGSVITFTPEHTLQPSIRYKVFINPGISDIDGNKLGLKIWSFTTYEGNLFPLAIGNKWVYECNGNVDSIFIVKDTIISERHYYLDQINRRYYNENDEIEIPAITGNFLFGNYQKRFRDAFCENANIKTVATGLGTLDCYYYWGLGVIYDMNFDAYVEYYFADGIGPVKMKAIYTPKSSGYYGYSYTWDIIRYELKE
jgi:hypothetical protein